MVKQYSSGLRNLWLAAAVLSIAALSGPAGADDFQLWIDDGGGNPGGTILDGYWVGDMNCDGVMDFRDINPFVLALTDPDAYHATFPDCDIRSADLNCDGQINFDDINACVQRIACLECGPGPWWCVP